MPRAAAGGPNAEPAEDSASGATLGRVAGLKRIVHCYGDPALTKRVSAPSAFEPGEQKTLNLSFSLRLSQRLCVSASN
jgi:hypothetical protein